MAESTAAGFSANPAELNPYQLLGVSVHTPEEDIRRAYYQTARQVHPDRNPDARAEGWMKQVNEAYRILSNKILRRSYDERLQNEDPDDGTWDPARALPEGRRPSEEFKKLFLQWKRIVKIDGLGQFLESLESNLKRFLHGPCKELVRVPTQACTQEKKGKKIVHGSMLDEAIQDFTKLGDEPSLTATTNQTHKVLHEILERVQTSSHGQAPAPSEGDMVPIIDLTSATDNDLRMLLSLFTSADVKKLCHKDLVSHLSKFVPYTHIIQNPADVRKQTNCNACGMGMRVLFNPQYSCFVCGNSFCNRCLQHRLKVPRLGQMKPQRVCNACYDHLEHQDEEDWVEASLRFVKTGTLESARAAFGCLAIVLCRCTSVQPIVRMASELLHLGCPELALPLLVPLLQCSEEPKQALRANLLTASALKSLADQPGMNWDDKWFLFMAAKEACVRGSDLLLVNSMDGSMEVEVPELVTKKRELELLQQTLIEKKEHDYNNEVEATFTAMEHAWKQRNWKQLLVVVSSKGDENLREWVSGKGSTIEAFEQFLAAREAFIDMMLPDDHFALVFFRGVLKLHQGSFSAGLIDIESAIWSGCHSSWLSKSAVDIVLDLPLTDLEPVLPLQALHTTCELLCKTGANSLLFGSVDGGSVSLLLPDEKELSPLSAIHWPELAVEGRNTMALRKYEMATAKKVQEGEWGAWDAALAYIDLCPACSHPAEIVMCFVIAALWFLRELQSKVSKASETTQAGGKTSHSETSYSKTSHSKTSHSETSHSKASHSKASHSKASHSKASHSKASHSETSEASKTTHFKASTAGKTKTTSIDSEIFAAKKAVLCCLQQAYTLARMTLHPGMQLYVSRLALGAALRTVQLAGNLATPEDSELVVQILHTLIYACRFCPFWHAPTVTVSEAVLLNILSGRLHCEFVLSLQHSQPKHIIPVRESELKYQLYENDLCHVFPLQDPPGVRARAMEEMLHEKGWSWEDVVQLMTSPLSPRNDEGWLVQQPVLGTSLEYAELKGFVLNLDSSAPSIKLLVVPAGQRVGLFSQSDVNTVLRLKADELFPIFFSLDPPSVNEHFHPFQELRYIPDELWNTNFLHTLFQTDYLLKSFSVGSDVSAKPPFNQRPCSEGLTANLPPRLRQVLKPMMERGFSRSNMHRFWIQADELVYDEHQSGSWLEVRFGKTKMVVRSHPLIPGLDGKLQDTQEDDDPDSPEAQFAADLTSHYDELGHHYPMFARLRELVKLQFLGVVLNSVLKDLQEKAKGCGIQVTDRMLHEVQQHYQRQHRERVSQLVRGMPQDFFTIVSSAIQEVQCQMGLGPMNYWELHSKVEEAMHDRFISEVANSLVQCCQYKVAHETMKYYVNNWICNPHSPTAEQELRDLICSALPLPTRNEIQQQLLHFVRQQHMAFSQEVERLQAAARKQMPCKPKNRCKWVPAALLKQESRDGTSFSLCYGGILIAPEIKKGTVPPLRHDVCQIRIQDSSRYTQRSLPYTSQTSQFFAPNGPSSPASGGSGGSSGSGGRSPPSGSGGSSSPPPPPPSLPHRWSHVFTDKDGHIKPKEGSYSRTLMKNILRDVAKNGQRTFSTWAKDMHEKAVEAGGEYKVRTYKNREAWVQIDKHGTIVSGGVNRMHDQRVKDRLPSLLLLRGFVDTCQQNGEDPGTPLSNATSTLFQK